MAKPTKIVGTENNDTLEGGPGPSHVYGLGGEDLLFGDARGLTGSAQGGDDKLSGGDGNDYLLGGALERLPSTQGGNDIFIFAPDSGNDRIGDFEDGKDRIDVQGYGFHQLSDLGITNNDTAVVTVAFGGGNQVEVSGFEGSAVSLSVADFIFA
jgi:Ca2+-binding RTX toxin-like protein